MLASHSLRRAATFTLALTLTMPQMGCSFIFTEGPPPNHEQMPYFDCSTSYAPPVLDSIWAGLNGFGAILALATSEAEWQRERDVDRKVAIISGLLWLGLSGASAMYGYREVGACKAATQQLMLRLGRPPGAPQSWPPPAGYPPPGYPPPGYPPPGYPPPGEPPPEPAPPPGQPPASDTPPKAPAPSPPAPSD